MAQFAIPTPDENLQPGWNVQGNGATQATVGVPGAGYAQAAAVPASVVGVGQLGSGVPNPPGALNIGSENSATYSTPILENGSYAVTPTTLLTQPAASTPVPTTGGVQNPFGMNATISITSGASATTVAVAPFTTGTPSYGPNISLTASGVTQVSVPPAGFIKAAVPADITAVSWVPTN
jgi:hypothetical protein